MGEKGGKRGMSVAGKNPGRNPGEPLERCGWGRREGGGMRGVAVKCIDIEKNDDCEGSLPAPV